MRNPYFPFHSMGFRCNPFRSLTDGEWTQIVVLHPTLEAISTAGFTHLQVLGDPGYGKTSTLLGLRAHYTKLGKRAAYEYLPPGKRVFTTDIRDLEVFLLDEFQRLSTRHRRQLIKEVATWPDDGLQLVFSSHVDFAAHFAKHALPLTTIHLGGYDVTHLSAILEKRIRTFALADPPGVSLSVGAMKALWEEYDGNLRDIESFLYHVFQNLEKQGEIGADQLYAAFKASPPGEARG